jgi:thiamine-phosphate pyrophosphorylase
MHEPQAVDDAGSAGPRPQGAAAAWRIIDASANRAGEALRVLEDVVRFGLDDPALTARFKDLRHDLAVVLAGTAVRQRAALRDISGDVGVDLAAAAPLPRRSLADLVAANAARAGQALRSLEETSLVVAPAAAAAFAALRYRLYEAARRAAAAVRSRDRLGDVRLCVLVDGQADEAGFVRLVETLLAAGVRMLQVRDASLPVPVLAARVREAVAAARRHDPAAPALVIVNDRVDVAAAVGASGGHVGRRDLPVPLARRVLGPDAVLGATAHDLEEARAAVGAGADYLGVGPCFPSSTKSFERFATPEFLGRVAAEVSLPAFAIGGITLDRLDEVFACGLHRVAVAAAVTRARDPAAAARSLLDRLGEAGPRSAEGSWAQGSPS